MSWGPPRVHHAVMYQSWCSLTFLHWRYRVDALRKLVPQPLEIDTFDGSAWVAITPFVLRGLRPPFLPALPWISAFPETNCRTYVKAPDGSSGVWFFSLDSARAPAAYATTKGAIVTFTKALSQLAISNGIRVNAVAPGPVWTPLIPSTMPGEHVSEFGKSSLMERPGATGRTRSGVRLFGDLRILIRHRLGSRSDRR